MIPQEKIEEVRERASIVEVVSDYVPLRRQGHNHIGLCPFHSEKTPSFSVSEEKKIYYCFGCHETGNVISFLMKKEGMEFPDAVRNLASRFGVVIEEQKRTGAVSARDELYLANTVTAEYFATQLAGSSGRIARRYLEERGYGGQDELIRRFRIGYAPESWDGLTAHLRRKRVSTSAAEKAGVISVSNKSQRRYDRFRSRLMFPITDMKGRVVGFGGRALGDADKGPKYLNSPETAIFKKGEILYGLHQAKKSIMDKRSVIVVEGYFDLLALHRHGFTNTVATMGTALTVAQIRALKGLADMVYTLFDTDSAGVAAAVRSLELFLDEQVPCRAITLEGAKDPDELLAAKGADAMHKAVKEAEPLMEFYLRDLRHKIDVTTPEGKARYLDTAMPFLTRVKNVAERDHYAHSVASTLSIPPASVYEAVRSGGRTKGGRTPAAKAAARPRGAALKELTVLKVLLTHPELYSDRVAEAIEAFADPALREAGRVVSSFCRSGRELDAGALLDEITDAATRRTVAGILMKQDDGFVESPERMLQDCLKKILDSGKLKDSTLEVIRSLEEAGKTEMARQMRSRILGETTPGENNE